MNNAKQNTNEPVVTIQQNPGYGAQQYGQPYGQQPIYGQQPVYGQPYQQGPVIIHS